MDQNFISDDNHSKKMLQTLDNQIFNVIELNPESIPFHCNHCKSYQMSQTKLVPGLLTYLSAGIICLFG